MLKFPRLKRFCVFYIDHFANFNMLSSEGSNLTPAHHFPDFRLKTYAPLAFRYFRELFGIKPDDYLVSVQVHIIIILIVTEVSVEWIATLAAKMMLHLSEFQYSICNEPLIELSNPGASSSWFYLTGDDEFIIKTVQHKEAEFLQKLLPGYYMVSYFPKLLPFTIYTYTKAHICLLKLCGSLEVKVLC